MTPSVQTMHLRDLAAAYTAGAVTYEQVQQEHDRRRAAGLDTTTGRVPELATAPAPTIAAVACPTCHALTRAPEVSK